MPKYFIYCRKSSEAEDRQILSIESQINELKQLAEQLNLSVIEVLTEAKSAKEPGRPVFNEMVKQIYRGEAQGVLSWKLDRLARNPVDGGSIIWAIKQHGIKIITPTQTFSHEEDNTILMYIEFGMAQKYIDDLSRNVKRGIKTKLEKGWYPTHAPVGYLNITSKITGEKTISKDPERFHLLRKMWDLMLKGVYTPPQILDIVNHDWGFKTLRKRKLGGKHLSRSGIYRLFTNSFYYGWFEYPKGSDQWYHGVHEPIITEGEYDRVQVLLGRKGNPRAQKHTFSFTGLIRCGECVASITAEEKLQIICSECRFKFSSRNREQCPKCNILIEKMENPTRLHYIYYHCTKRKDPSCSQRAIEVKKLEKQIKNYLLRVQISENFKEWAIKELRETHEKEMQGRNAIVQSQQKSYKDCLRRLDNLVTLKTSPENTDGSLLSDEEYSRQRMALQKEKARLEEIFNDPGHRVDKCLELSEKTFEFACYAKNWFSKGGVQTKREILTAIGSNLTLKDKKVIFKAVKPFFILEKFTSGQSGENGRLEPGIEGLNKRQTETFASVSPTLRGYRDDVRTFSPQMIHRLRIIVNEVWQFFKTSDRDMYIPNFINTDGNKEDGDVVE